MRCSSSEMMCPDESKVIIQTQQNTEKNTSTSVLPLIPFQQQGIKGFELSKLCETEF